MYSIVFLFDKHTAIRSIKEVAEQLPTSEVAVKVHLLLQKQLDKESLSDGEGWKTLDSADFIIIESHGSITFFKKFNEFWERYKHKNIYFQTGIEEELIALMPEMKITRREYAEIYRYVEAKTTHNIYALSLFLANRYGQANYNYEAAIMPCWQGVYHPSKKDWDKVKKEIAEARENKKPVVALLFHYYLVANKNLKHIDTLIKEIENQDAYCISFFTTSLKDERTEQKGIGHLLKHYLQDGTDETLVDVVVNSIGHSMTIFENNDSVTTDTDSAFAKLGVPVIHAFPTYFSREVWEESIQGLDAMSLVSAIYYPEFDGQKNSYPIATHEYDKELKEYAFAPLTDRIEIVARLAINWAKLKQKKAEEKRIAIILHNMPPRNDMIGCAAGLDTPASVYNIVDELKKEGVSTSYDFENGDEIIYKIIEGVSNDTSWVSTEEMLERSVDIIETKTYKDWYEDLTSVSQQQIEKDWGNAPGTFRTHDGKLPIPGILNGNIFIGLQPPRGYDEQAEKCYHSTDIVCPHQYIAFYKWVKKGFGADVIIHVGTHGTLEWLPGKEKGLSKSCFPAINIDDIPHLYPYHTSVIGEGIQAKRRSAAVLLNHLPPSATESGTYDELTNLDSLLKEYMGNINGRQAQQEGLKEDIWTLCCELHLNVDMQVSDESIPENFEGFATKLHAWIEIIKQSSVKDGLHIFGKVPKEERYPNMVRVLVRTANGEIKSLVSAIATASGYNYEIIRTEPEKFYSTKKTGYILLDDFIAKGKEIVDELDVNDYQIYTIPNIIKKYFSEKSKTQELSEVLKFICTEVVTRLDKTVEELIHTATGVEGAFVPPGQGGTPSRGNTLILPTGRNMFALDPSAVPSRAAHKVGVKMAEELIERYKKDEEKLPEAIGMVLYSGDQMRTSGEDIAEILHLMGVRPCWLGASSRVTGVELIPLTELNRPRLDVTCRISGLLRDTFPMLIALLDDAVKLVASADEPEEMNYIKKHFNEDITDLKLRGIDSETARKEALLRVFGCPPGTYGGGVEILVESKAWNSNEDLADISVTWSCHAYSNELHGKVCKKSYTQRLSKVELTLKNENTTDFDMYDIDDEFIYHGGMIAAVKKYSGKKPQSYYGNSSDPEHTKLASVSEETARIMRSRLLNPLWIDGLKKHGYKGAQDVSYNMDNVFGWDATADIVEDWAYEALANHFLFDKENQEWLSNVNPWAVHHITEKLLEAIQREMWNADKEMIEKLQNLYLNSEGDLEAL